MIACFPRMGDIRMIALDMDGTTLLPDHVTVPPLTSRMLAECTARGIVVVPATGRAVSLIEPVAAQLGSPRVAVSANGARVCELGSGAADLMPRPRIGADTALALQDEALSRGLPLEVYHGGKSYYRADMFARITRVFPPVFQRYLREHSEVVPDYTPVLAAGDVEKVSILGMDEAQRTEVRAALDAYPDITVVSSDLMNCEISARGVSKASGLASLADQLGIRPAEVLACGDSGNDLAMLTWAGCSVAMGNAAVEAIRSAQWVCPANVDDGVGQVLSRMLEGGDLTGVLTPAAEAVGRSR